MTRYFKATDGVLTVFRSSARQYRAASFVTRPSGDAFNLSFSAGSGSYPATEITKAEYDALQAAKIRRVTEAGGNLRWASSPQCSWVRNSALTSL